MKRLITDQGKEVELYLVKWKNLSYVHCSWESEEELTQFEGPHIKQKIQVCLCMCCDLQRFYRFENEIVTEINAYGEDIFFNPEFLEADRILETRIVQEDVSKTLPSNDDPEVVALLAEDANEGKGTIVKEFLVKWKSMQYADSTWEVFSDFQNPAVIQEYYQHQYKYIFCVMQTSEYLFICPLAGLSTTIVSVREGVGHFCVQEP